MNLLSHIAPPLSLWSSDLRQTLTQPAKGEGNEKQWDFVFAYWDCFNWIQILNTFPDCVLISLTTRHRGHRNATTRTPLLLLALLGAREEAEPPPPPTGVPRSFTCNNVLREIATGPSVCSCCMKACAKDVSSPPQHTAAAKCLWTVNHNHITQCDTLSS